MPFELFLGGLALVLGVLIACEQALFLLRGWASRAWSRVPGRVIESRPVRNLTPSGGDSRASWYPNGVRLAYEYTLGGERFVGHQSSWRGYWPTLGNVARRAQRYPVGSEVTVWVNPEKPRQAVLEPGFGLMNVVGTVIGLSLLGLGLYTLSWWWGAA
jgi:dipeptidyl aminopeptidase/acylaminoacyl peptidase